MPAAMKHPEPDAKAAPTETARRRRQQRERSYAGHVQWLLRMRATEVHHTKQAPQSQLEEVMRRLSRLEQLCGAAVAGAGISAKHVPDPAGRTLHSEEPLLPPADHSGTEPREPPAQGDTELEVKEDMIVGKEAQTAAAVATEQDSRPLWRAADADEKGPDEKENIMDDLEENTTDALQDEGTNKWPLHDQVAAQNEETVKKDGLKDKEDTKAAEPESESTKKKKKKKKNPRGSEGDNGDREQLQQQEHEAPCDAPAGTNREEAADIRLAWASLPQHERQALMDRALAEAGQNAGADLDSLFVKVVAAHCIGKERPGKNG